MIAGITESGKSTLAKRFCHRYNAAGIHTAVLDPMNDPDWNATFQTKDPAHFLDTVWKNTKLAIFVDESAMVMGNFDKEMHELFTAGRHFGFNCHVIAQRPMMIPKTVRGQCSFLFLFCLATEECKELKKEFNAPEIMDAGTFQKGEYLKVGRFSPSSKGQLTW